MKHDLEAFTAALLARRPDLGLQENATLHSDISAAFRAYAEEMIAQPQIDPGQNQDRHRAHGSDEPL
jgi:hypothetical protein